MNALKTVGSVSLALGLALGLGAAEAKADAVADFYKGKRIQLLVGSGPGGGYDTYARLLARHMGNHIPGRPSFVVQNMDGAGSIVMLNFVANVAPKDGTVIAGLQRNAPMVQIMGGSGPQFRSEELNWLGSLADEAGACAIAARTGARGFDDVLRTSFIVGGTGPNDTEINPAIINNLLGGQFRLIRGYPSTPPVHLAIARGEVDGICQSWASLKEQGSAGFADGSLVPIVQLSMRPVPELSAMGVPLIYDFITQDRIPAGMTVDEVRNYFDLVMGVRVMGRPFAMAPGIPADRVAAMRAAFIATAKDPAFLAEAERQRRDIDLVTGEEIDQVIATMVNTPRERLARLDDLLKFQGPTQQAKVELIEHTGPVTAVEGGGRSLTVDASGTARSAGISGSRTKVTINGADADRGAIQVGMTCTIALATPDAKEASEIHCKN